MDGDRDAEIIFKTRNYGVLADIYYWNGKGYILGNNRFVNYYNSELDKLVETLRSERAYPTSAWVMWAREVTEIYSLQQRHSAATELLESVLKTIDDATRTTSNTVANAKTTPEQRATISAAFHVEKTKAKATLLRLLGDTHKHAGLPERAQDDYKKAEELERSLTMR